MLLLRDPGRELLKPGQLSPRLDVPANIQRPPYVDTGENPWIEDIQVHTKDVCIFFVNECTDCMQHCNYRAIIHVSHAGAEEDESCLQTRC